jgi:hypothetical protein
MHGLQTINRLNTQAVPQPEALPLGERVDDNGVAHGLRQHSIGSTYPAVVVAYGSGSYGVQYGTHVVPAQDNHAAQGIAERIASAHRSGGVPAGLRQVADELKRQR